MLFSAADPSDRYKVLQRFYRLPKPLIERFYAGKLQARDKARILVGKPPVPIRRAMNCVNEHNYLRRMQ
jgi:lycopene beta-cyclase